MKLFKKLLLSAAAIVVTSLLCMVCVGAEKSGFWDYEVNSDGKTVTITGYTGVATGYTLETPTTIDGKPVTAIGYEAFYENKNISKVFISEGVITIGAHAFRYSSLTEITLPSTLDYIGYSAFSELNSLTKCNMGANVTCIGDYAFFRTGIKTISLPNTLSYIGYYAFGESDLTEIRIPSSVTKWHDKYGDDWDDSGSAFASCENLKKAVIGNCVMKDAEDLFYDSPVTIYCMEGTPAEQYAKDNNIPYKTTVKSVPATSLSFNKDFYTVRVGETLKINPVVSPANTTDKLSWVSNDEEIAEVGSSGLVERLKPGTIIIGCQTDSGKFVTCEVLVTEDKNKQTSVDPEVQRNISLGKINAINPKAYTGKAIKPEPIVMFNDLTKLVKDFDYTVSYKNNTKAGTATVTVKGIGRYTGTLSRTFSIVDLRVNGFKVSGKNGNSVTLSWDKNPSASGYVIQQYIDGKWIRIEKVTKNSITSYKVPNLSATTRYAFRIQGYKQIGSGAIKSEYSDKLVAYTNPTDMSGFKLGGRTDSVIRLEWKKNNSATGYIIEQYKDNKWVRIAKITDNATTLYRVTGLTASTRYAFRIQAYTNIPGSAVRTPFTSKLVIYTKPKEMSGVKISSTTTTATLTWNKNTSATGYIIEQYKSGRWVRIAKITNNSTTSFKVTKLAKGTTYKFRIQAYKNIPNGALRTGFVTVSVKTKV